tara:strand:- start:713 stop:1540 length:828 start_codon:yes stop_codon:yes gene_type:complete
MSNTERVEINPSQIYDDVDTSQENLAKEGIDITKDVVTSKDGTVAEISTPDTRPMGAESSDGTRPDWLPEKFTSAEEMAKAYSELEKKQSSGQEETQTEEQPQDDGDVEQVPLQKFYDEFETEGGLSEKSYNELEELGLPKGLVDSYIEGQKAIANTHIDAVHQTVGGKENYESLMGWASDNLSEQEKNAFNHTVDYGTVEQINMALGGLMSRAGMSPNTPKQPDLFEGVSPDYSSDAPYASINEMTTDMNNPKYEKDPAFREMVERRLGKSSII